MNSRIAHIAVAVASICTLAVVTTTASANRLSVSSRLVVIKWSPLNFIAATNTIRCNVTLEASFHSMTIRKVERALIGHVSRVTVNTCTGGSATLLKETLPWHLRYAGFTGTLPAIRKVFIQMVGFALALQPSGSLKCLMRSTETAPMRFEANLNEATGEVRELRAEEGAEIPLEGEGGLCRFAGEGHYGGNSSRPENGAGGAVIIRLI